MPCCGRGTPIDILICLIRGVLDPGAPNFSLINAWWLCELSRLIYRQDPDEVGSGALPPTRSKILHGVGLKEIHSFCDGTNYCALVTPDTEGFDPFAVLVFRGTLGFKSWPSKFEFKSDILARRRLGSRRI